MSVIEIPKRLGENHIYMFCIMAHVTFSISETQVGWIHQCKPLESSESYNLGITALCLKGVQFICLTRSESSPGKYTCILTHSHIFSLSLFISLTHTQCSLLHVQFLNFHSEMAWKLWSLNSVWNWQRNTEPWNHGTIPSCLSECLFAGS